MPWRVGTLTGELREVRIGDEPAAWASAGFRVTGDHLVLDDVVVRLVGAGRSRGLLGWCLDGIDASIDGLTHCEPIPAPDSSGAIDGADHPNGITSIDHVVVETDDFDRTVPALLAVGIDERRARTFMAGGIERRQSFFWVGSVILELVGRAQPSPGAVGPARFWGLALTSADLDATVRFLGDRTSEARAAVQPGRRISTVRTRALDISIPLAIMSPHP